MSQTTVHLVKVNGLLLGYSSTGFGFVVDVYRIQRKDATDEEHFAGISPQKLDQHLQCRSNQDKGTLFCFFIVQILSLDDADRNIPACESRPALTLTNTARL